MKRFFRRGIRISLILAVVITSVHGGVVNNYWLFDDLQILRHAATFEPWEYFFLPDAWQKLSVANLTPLVTLSFDIDYRLFGFDPRWFYLHHLISLWFVAVILYALLRLWLSEIFALFGVLLFLTSAPAGMAAEFLMVRHYIEGSACSLFSLYLVVIAMRRDSPRLAVAAAVPYCIAVSAKEIYLPMMLIPLFIPEHHWRYRLKYTLPLLSVLFLYLGWRYWMLQRMIGGYHDALLGSNIFLESYRFAVSNPLRSLMMLVGASADNSQSHMVVFAWMGSYILISLVLCCWLRKYAVLIFFTILFLCVFAPISVKFIYLDPHDFATYRWVYFSSLFFAVLAACMAFNTYDLSCKEAAWPAVRIRSTLRMLILLSCLGLSLVVFVNAFHWRATVREKVIKPLCREGIFLMNHEEESLVVKSFVYPFNNYYENLDYFRSYFRGTQIPDVVFDTFAFIDEKSPVSLNGKKVYQYDRDLDEMSDITQEFHKKRNEYRSRIRSLPLLVKLVVKRNRLSIQLGPEDSGRYFFVTGYRPGLYLTSIDIGRTVPDVYVADTAWYFRFGWESPGGWVTFTPEWLLDFSKDQAIEWKQGT